MPHKRILFMIPTLGGGGAEGLFIRWIKHFQNPRLGQDIELAVVFSIGKEGPFLEDLDPSILVYELGQDPTWPLDLPWKAWELARIYREFRPDLVVSMITHANIMALLAARLFSRRTKVVICEHTYLSANIKDYYPRASSLLKPFIRMLYPWAHRIIAPSKGVKEDLVATFGQKPEHIKVIYYPIDPALVRRLAGEKAAWPIADHVPAVLGMGRFVNQKGFVYLIRAMALVRRQISVQLVLVGTGPLREQLESEVRRLDLQDVVHFPGFQKNSLKYLSRASVFVLPSLYEGLGLVLLEALAAGIPVVATRCPGGPNEIIEDGVNGLLVPVADEKALAASILRLLGDPSLRRSLVAQGLRKAAEFPWEAHIRDYLNIFLDT